MPAVRGPDGHLVGLHLPRGDGQAQEEEASRGVEGGAGGLQEGPPSCVQVQGVPQQVRDQGRGREAREENALRWRGEVKRS